ncbi:MAG: glycosyltransferase [Chloroflexi bacterium]|nr:glycosyltransferase [Chloroflexota bacterium]
MAKPNNFIGGPQLSIVIASINGLNYLSECLSSLKQQDGEISAEIIVVDCVGDSVTNFVTAQYPGVRLIPFDTPMSIPALRGSGIRAASGEIIAITEDHCIAPKDWFQTIWLSHQEQSATAIGGSVENAATERLTDWAVFFCEYSNFLSPIPVGVVHDLPGPNVSYKRDALGNQHQIFEGDYYEYSLHQNLESKGHHLWSDPSIRILHKRHYRVQDFFIERFHYGRWFAGTRKHNSSWPKQLYFLIFSPLLPLLILGRISQRVISRRKHLVPYIKSLPTIFLFTFAWALGEFIGYATGPGKSVLRLR